MTTSWPLSCANANSVDVRARSSVKVGDRGSAAEVEEEEACGLERGDDTIDSDADACADECDECDDVHDAGDVTIARASGGDGRDTTACAAGETIGLDERAAAAETADDEPVVEAGVGGGAVGAAGDKDACSDTDADADADDDADGGIAGASAARFEEWSLAFDWARNEESDASMALRARMASPSTWWA